MRTEITNMATSFINACTYKTGFEHIKLDTDHLTLCESVISSVIPFDGELLIIGQSDVCSNWKTMCRAMSINTSVIDIQDTEADLETALTAILNSNKHITHIICSTDRATESLKLIGDMARTYHKSLIADNTSDTIDFSEVNTFSIDFLLTAGADIYARRSRLVQTEGNARLASHDIYAMWQRDVRARRATLEPMAC